MTEKVNNVKLGKQTCVLTAAIVALVIAGCGDSGKQGGTMNTSLFGGDPGKLAFDVGTVDAAQVSDNLFDGLTKVNADSGEAEAKVADDWKSNKDFTTWTFNLKRDYKFCNGETVTAESFKTGWEATTNPAEKSFVAFLFAGIKGTDDAGASKNLTGVTTPSKFTLKVNLKDGDNIFHKKVAHPAFAPVPTKYYADNKKSFATKPVGNGPFCVTSYKTDRSISTKANKFYKGDDRTSPELDKLVYKIFPDEDAAYKAFRAGDVDEAEVPFAKRKQASGLPNTDFVTRPLLSTGFYGFKVNEDPWKGNNGKLLRQAISYAVDRKNIAKNVMGGGGEPADGFVPPDMAGYRPGASPYDHNPDKAKKLLEDAGYTNGQGLPSLTLGFSLGSGAEKIAAAVQSDLAKVGIKMKTKGVGDFGGVFLPQIESGQIDFFGLAWIADFNSQQNFLFPNFSSTTIPDGNLNHYRNKEFDSLLDQAVKEADESKSEDLYREAEELLFEDPPIVALYFNNSSRIVNTDRIVGYERSPEDITPYEKISLK